MKISLCGRNILLISPEAWNHIFVSKHHYAIYLAKRGNKVFFLNPPSGRNNIWPTTYEDVFSVEYDGFPRGLRFYLGSLRRYFVKRKFKELQRVCGVIFDVIWTFDNSVFFDLQGIPSEVLKISHVVDLNQNFQVGRAASSADFCFCTTNHIRNRLLRYNINTHKIHHGFNVMDLTEEKSSLPGDNHTKAVYAGNLAMKYIDWILLDRLVNENPNVDFVFVGPNMESICVDLDQERSKRIVAKATNSFAMGKCDPRELLRLLRAADILLVTYQERHHTDQANPHKMMEYFGVGKMIVATFTEEYLEQSSNGLFLMSASNASLPGLFRQALNELDHWNSPSKRSKRQSFAERNSYSCQIESIEQILNLADKSSTSNWLE